MALPGVVAGRQDLVDRERDRSELCQKEQREAPVGLARDLARNRFAVGPTDGEGAGVGLGRGQSYFDHLLASLSERVIDH